MATNPMQRQARNSFLLGMVITLVIAAAIVTLLFMQIKKLNEQIKSKEMAVVQVYTLNQDVKSGQTLTADMFKLQSVNATAVPADATSDIKTTIATYSLCDKQSNNIYTDSDGTLYMMVNNTKTTVYKEEATDKYYVMSGSNKNYIETTQKDLVAKVGLKANTVITSSLIARSNEIDTDDVREQEYNMLVLPTDLFTGDYVDIRFMLPNGQDFIVVSKKEVTVPIVGGSYLADTIKFKLSEEEILAMSSAIVEAYKMEGSKLYVSKYTEAGLQAASTPTYVVNDEVANLIEANPNIVTEALNALRARYNANNRQLKNMRNQYINSALSTYGDNDKVKDKMQESITSTKEAREEYLQSLTGGVTQ